MSNYLAIATVTEAIRQMLDRAIKPDFNKVLDEATATAVRPNAGAVGLPKLGVNLYLYQISHNAAFRNADLPTRRADGSVSKSPRVALDLHYLFSFYGEESKLEPQQVLGSVIRTLHASPALIQKQIRHIIETSGHLNQSDLDREIERIKLSPLPLALEELSRIWSVFFQNSYTLSVAYQASVVFIDGMESPSPSLPVMERNLYVLPFGVPAIDGVLSQTAEGEPLVPNPHFLARQRLIFTGNSLCGDRTAVRIDGEDIPVANILDVKDNRVTISLPPDLPAGVHTVLVAHKRMIGTPETEHSGVESNAVPFLLCPAITVPATPVEPVGAPDDGGKTIFTTSIAVGFDPAVGRDQRVALIMNEYQAHPVDRAVFYRIAAPAHNGITDAGILETGSIVFALTSPAKPAPGKYICRVLVDGAESLVSFDRPGPLLEIQNAP
jgi:hypothetical protein